MAKLPRHFQELHSAIGPSDKDKEKITSARGRLDSYIDGHALLSKIRVNSTFLQGSYKNNTLVRPLDGDFDVDVGYPVSASFTDGFDNSRDALKTVAAALAEDRDYRERLELLTRCIRLDYAGEFHLDFVPFKTATGEFPYEVADPPRWKITTPRKFDAWVHDVNSKECKERFVRTVKFLKRWRDHHFTEAERPPSLVLTAFAGTHHPYRSDVQRRFPRLATSKSDSDAAFFLDTVIIMEDCIRNQQKGFKLPNPVRPREDLARRLTATQLHALRTNLNAVALGARRAYAESDEDESARLWQEVFGDAFPLDA